MTVDKKEIPVVILAAGEAKRLKPLSNQIIKPIVPINGIPLINRVIENYYDNGFEKFYIVISPEEKGIKNTVSEFELVKNNKVFAEFLIQQEAKGMADAILTTYEKVKDHKCFIVTAADVLYEKDTPTLMLEKHIENESYLTLSLIYSEDEKMSVGHGNCVLKENHMVEKIIEKPGPEKKIGNYYSMPTYIFSTEFFNAIKHVKTSERGEYEIQDAIVLAIKNNKKVLGVNILPKMKNFKFKNVGAYHITYIKDLLDMNFRLLVNGGLEFEGEYPTSIEPVNSSGKIVTGDSVLLGPKVYLGDNCELEDLVEISESILLGNNTIGKRVMIENSIIGPNVKILGAEEVQKFKNCLLLVKTDGKSFEKHDLS